MKKIKNLFAKIKDPKIMRILIVVVVAVLLIGGFFLYEKLRDRVAIEDSLVSAPIVSISPDAQGKILAIKVYDGEKVRKGDDLATVGTKTLNAYEDGLIVSTNNAIGSLANPQIPVVSMINFSDMRIAGTLDENKGLDKVRIGQAVSFTVDAILMVLASEYFDENDYIYEKYK